MRKKINNCKTKQDLKENIREILIALEGILVNTMPSLEDTAQIMYGLYKINYAPLTAVLKGAIVNDDYFWNTTEAVRPVSASCRAVTVKPMPSATKRTGT